MLTEAKRTYPEVCFWCGDVVDLPVGLGCFDVIFFNAMFGNVWDQGETLQFSASRLNAAGRLLISHPMGAAFVQELHRGDPDMVPHTLPDRTEIAIIIEGSSLKLNHFRDEPDLYLAILEKQ